MKSATEQNLPMVLLVDDDEKFLAAAHQVFDKNDFILEATTGRQALDLAKAIELSLALVDLDLPGQSGFEVIEKIHEAQPRLPIVAISGVCSRASLESALVLGATEVLGKPISPEWKQAVTRVRRSE